jgi:hypothetical protein
MGGTFSNAEPPTWPPPREAHLHREIARLRAERDSWIRAFNRLQGAVQHHRNAGADSGMAGHFVDTHDESLYAAHDAILRDLTKGEA